MKIFSAIIIVSAIAGFFAFVPNFEKDSGLFTASLLQSNVQNEEELQPTEELIIKEAEAEPIEPVVLSRQDLLDDIQEKLDIISRQVQDLIAENKEDIKEPEEKIEKIEEIEEIAEETVSCIGQININTASVEDLDKITGVGPVTVQKIIAARPFYSINGLLNASGIGEMTLQKIIEQGCAYVEPGLVPPSVGGGSNGGGPETIVYPKILISEVQIVPIDQRFIELYNPNNFDVDLVGWYLQRKTQTSDSWSSLVSSSKFEGKKILAHGYFLISRSDTTVDMTVDNLTLTPNNFLALKSPDGEINNEANWSSIASDLSWCFDFELCTPTSKAQNVAYVVPPPIDDGSNDIGGSNDINGSNDVIFPVIVSYTFNGLSQNIIANPIENSIQIDVVANENVDWISIKIENISDSGVYKYFYPGSSCDGKSNCTNHWNGSTSHGTFIDGDYKIKVHIKDAASNEFNDYIAPYIITVDTTLP